MKYLIGRPFQKGDKAYIISPSAGLMPFVPKRVARAKNALEILGYEVIMSKIAVQNQGYVSASVMDRIKDIHTAFKDKSCSLVLCSIGGNHSNQLLEGLDYQLIKSNPKAFCGYSDITVLHLAILAKTGLATYYGPTFLNQFGEYPQVLDFTLSHFRKNVMRQTHVKTKAFSSRYSDEILDWFSDQDSIRARKLIATPPLQTWKAGKAVGSALPFTIPSVNHVINTEYMPKMPEPILLIDIPEGTTMHEGLSIGEFDSWFCDVMRSGLVKEAAGLVIGRAYKYSRETVKELESVVVKRCAGIDIPIIYGLDMGHTDPMLSIRHGSRISIDTAARTKITFE